MTRHLRPARRATMALALTLALLGTACLEKETSSTVYVEADGTVTWTIVESQVRSDHSDVGLAQREEDDYLRAHQAGLGSLGVALAEMGGEDVRSEVLRDRVPLATLTSARFSSLDVLARSYCQASGWACASATERQGRQVTWTWTISTVSDGAGDDRPVRALDDALGKLRVVLAEGRILAAKGFEVENRAATLAPPEDEDVETYTFSLTWETKPSAVSDQLSAFSLRHSACP